MGEYHGFDREREPIAIIGGACRFPGRLNTPSKLWEFLSHPRDLLSKIPALRFNADAFFHPDGAHHGTSNVTSSYFLDEDPRVFDAAFFNIKPVEAHSIDPQHRILLEVVYEALEAAGQSVEVLAGSQTGMYVGLMCSDFEEHLKRDTETLPTYATTGMARSLIANRISYFFDWRGPSMMIDTACSSSLFAVHHAVQLLRSGDSDVAVAAGSNLIFNPDTYAGESSLKMLSPTGRSRMWDASADGYGRGEGVAAVILKRLSDAIRDGDQIESIIRESGVNSDGRTKGLTMPNELAQADLISRTYKKAGLDPTKQEDRCQFFEAHGTGTEAGDRREAEGISRAFFGYDGTDGAIPHQADKMYVGSIKTVIGHTEGTAGVAGLLKVSQAVHHGMIPPNMLFDRLSPQVAPFYHGVEIPTEVKPWPRAAGGVRRASVNSFGFGGANAHVIVESHEPQQFLAIKPSDSQISCSMPFVFSAASDTALTAMLDAYAAHLTNHPDLSILDLAHTLHARRSALGVRAAFPAVASATELATSITNHLTRVCEGASSVNVGTRPISAAPRVLGVFTGQGAQWATMGKELIEGSAFVRQRVEAMEAALSNLPESDRPSWSLVNELSAGPETSRLSEAALAQPLCSAVQIVIVDLLREANIEFAAVVGHSSGEIAAAYAARMISADEAIKIAYYRGLCVEKYGRSDGAMIAVGTSFEDATELCGFEELAGRVSVAACNSASSVTLSGDVEAINEAQAVLVDEKKFARLLKVDKAYHSHHMEACSSPYLTALEACQIAPQTPNSSCAWYSSVYPGVQMGFSVEDLSGLRGKYWSDNMLRPVLFAQALETACSMNTETPFNMAIEVGPHPALKGPASETLAAIYAAFDMLMTPPAYTGTLVRGSSDIGSLSTTLGAVWTRFTQLVANMAQYDAALRGQSARRGRLLTGLPTYQWDHDRIFWHDSRISRAIRMHKAPPHPLLGRRAPDGTGADEMRWRNIIRPSELPWLRGHQLQGQIVYPAAAYISTAVEACFSLGDGRVVQTVEISELEIGRALVFDESNEQAGTETLFALSNIVHRGKAHITAVFTIRAAAAGGIETEVLSTRATGNVLVTLADEEGDAAQDSTVAPTQQSPELADMTDVSSELFYSSLETLGYQYRDDFHCLTGMQRRMDHCRAKVRIPSFPHAADAVLLHPALLDAVLQALFLAYAYPNDGSFDQLYLPVRVASVTIRVPQAKNELGVAVVGDAQHLPLASVVTSARGDVEGDIDLFARDGQTPLVHVQGARARPLAQGAPKDGQQLFREQVWGLAVPNGALAANIRAMPRDFELAEDLDRLCVHYINKVVQEVPPSQRQGAEEHHEAMFNFFEHVLQQIRDGNHRLAKQEWLDDGPEVIAVIEAKHQGRVEVELQRVVSDNLAAAVRGETQILQHMFNDGLLDRFYAEASGFCEMTAFLARAIAQITHRYPRMDILELGAGTGSATKAVLREVGDAFATYTFTDISAGFMEKASQTFAAAGDRMSYRALDIEKDVVDQGFPEHGYDLVIASLVLHATVDLDKTVRETRRLLKPGGYLVLLEITNNDPLRIGFTMSGLPGWWLGRETESRRYSPCVSAAAWHRLLLNNGFSGIDTITPEVDTWPRPFSVIVSQAVDARVNLIREPMEQPVDCNAEATDGGELVIISGATRLSSTRLVDSVLALTRQFGFAVTRFSSLEEVDPAAMSATALILNLAELDEPVFARLTEGTMKGIQAMLSHQRTILWVTRGCRVDEPYMSMSVGLGRSLALESPDTRLQFLDLDVSREPDPRLVAETLLRLRLTRDKTSTEGMLYSLEPELAQEGDRLMVPRVMAVQAANDRLHAATRSITHPKSPREAQLLLESNSGGYTMHEAGPADDAAPEADELLVQVTASTLLPVTRGLYGVSGQEKGRDWVLGLSRLNGSRVPVLEGHLLRMHSETPASSAVQHELLALLAIELQVRQILVSKPPRGSILVHDPPVGLTSRLVELANERGVTVAVTLPAVGPARPDLPNAITLSGDTPRRLVRARLPRDVSLFVDASSNPDPDAVAGLGSLIACVLPSSCLRMTLKDMESLRPAPAPVQLELLEDLVARYAAGTRVAGGTGSFRILAPGALTTWEEPMELEDAALPTVVDWEAPGAVPVRVRPADNLLRFEGDKCYVLFGLTGELGRSLVGWMGSLGAKNVVLTSRRPQLDERWLEECRRKGMRVEVFANDITDATALKELVGKIRQSFPPIAGIMHGAMVLEDSSFPEMSLETMNKVVRPKVLGAINLDHLFRDDALDFCIFFSSIASAVGNRGQSNYSAANMYMAALALQRRRRGVAASVLHLGTVIGLGYMMHGTLESLRMMLYRGGFDKIHERWFHQCIAEAILTGRPDSGCDPEIITGIRLSDPDQLERSPWANNPRFQHCTYRESAVAADGTRGGVGSAAVAVRTLLLDVTTTGERLGVVTDAFLGRLQAILQTRLESSEEKAGFLAATTDDTGIDSLVAIEIRAWFQKEMDVDLPILKILGGATIAELVASAADTIPSALTPKLGNEPGAASEEQR